jgi:hypothetical protein
MGDGNPRICSDASQELGACRFVFSESRMLATGGVMPGKG